MLAMATAGPIDRFFDKWRAVLEAESAPAGGGSNCRLVGLKLTKTTQQGGYPVLKVTIPGVGKRSLSVARLLYMCSVKSLELEGDVSHLCHQKLCINIEHLVLEPRGVNNSRQICNNQQSCTRTHEPFCIFPGISMVGFK